MKSDGRRPSLVCGSTARARLPLSITKESSGIDRPACLFQSIGYPKLNETLATTSMLFTDAKLKAYASNELDLPDAGALEVMMAAEPDLARRAVFALVERRLGQAGFGKRPNDDSGIPSRQAVAIARRRLSTISDFAGRPTALPIAAGLAAAMLFAGIGYLAGQSSRPGGPIRLGKIEDIALRGALERVPTGGVENLRDGTLRVVGSFITGNGGFCRQFSFAGNLGRSQAIGCRQGKDWTVTFALLEPSDGADYTPADGTDSIGSYLQSLGATRPLTESVENELLDKGR